MDAADIDMQVLSLISPGTEQLGAADAVALAPETNDYLADAAQKNPTRFRGFASLPTATSDKAAQELERWVREQKFAGAVVNGHPRGERPYRPHS
jgi:predicted TIM-barrel fold metal-dependent hydrolase